MPNTFEGILPSVTYCISVWGNYSDHLMHKLESIHILAARFINRLNKSIPDSEKSPQKLQMDIACVYLQTILACLCYQAYNNLAPEAICDLVTKNVNGAGPNTRNDNNLPNFNKMSIKKAFTYRA